MNVIINQYYEYVNMHQISSQNQHGFRKYKSTSSNLLDFFNDVSNFADKSISTSIIYINLRKAFDSVPHYLLLLKFSRYGITGKMSRWLRDFLL